MNIERKKHVTLSPFKSLDKLGIYAISDWKKIVLSS